MDITFIIQKLEEIEKLKIVLFNDEQMALFSFITNELKSSNQDKIINHKMTNYKKLNKNKGELAKLIFSFRDRNRTDNVENEIDRKLFNLLKEEFK
jgi:hypothetical protein